MGGTLRSGLSSSVCTEAPSIWPELRIAKDSESSNAFAEPNPLPSPLPHPRLGSWVLGTLHWAGGRGGRGRDFRARRFSAERPAEGQGVPGRGPPGGPSPKVREGSFTRKKKEVAPSGGGVGGERGPGSSWLEGLGGEGVGVFQGGGGFQGSQGEGTVKPLFIKIHFHQKPFSSRTNAIGMAKTT